MNEYKKIYINGVFLGVVIGVAICFTAQYLSCRGNSTDTEATISNIKEQQHGITVEIGNATTNLREAENSVQRVSDTVGRVQARLDASQQIADYNAREISNISKIVSECRNLAEENRAIINSVGKTDSNVKEKE